MDEQAHAMSHPGTVMAVIGDPRAQAEIAAWYREKWTMALEEIKRLSAELAARTDAWEAAEWKLRGELSDARLEIERLRQERQAPSMATRKPYRWGML